VEKSKCWLLSSVLLSSSSTDTNTRIRLILAFAKPRPLAGGERTYRAEPPAERQALAWLLKRQQTHPTRCVAWAWKEKPQETSPEKQAGTHTQTYSTALITTPINRRHIGEQSFERHEKQEKVKQIQQIQSQQKKETTAIVIFCKEGSEDNWWILLNKCGKPVKSLTNVFERFSILYWNASGCEKHVILENLNGLDCCDQCLG